MIWNLVPSLQTVGQIKVYAVVECATAQNFLQLMTWVFKGRISGVVAMVREVYRIRLNFSVELVVKVVLV